MSNKLDFSTILASSVHDMKNSIGMMLFSIDEMLAAEPENKERLGQLHYDVLRVNNYLIQLMVLYKMDMEAYMFNVTEHEIYDFLLEQVARNQSIISSKGIETEIDADDMIIGYFDSSLIGGLVNNIVTNAVRYTDKKLRLSSYEEDGYVVIRIEDDGRGYPEQMLGDVSRFEWGVDFVSGSTGFGLYFSSQVAQAHENDGKTGFVRLENGGALGGGGFSLYLP